MVTMNSCIKYMKDEFLQWFRAQFVTEIGPLYQADDKITILRYFGDPANVVESDIVYEFESLEVESINSQEYDADIVRRNIRKVWNSLNKLTPVQAEMEKVWVALLHTDYIDYHLAICGSLLNSGKEPKNLASRTYFNNGAKRSLAINNLSLLWWLAYYFRDDKAIDPYHLLDFFLETPYRGNAVGLLSSNIISNKEIALGILEGVRYLACNSIIDINRYSFTESNRILNEIGGLVVLDALSRNDVMELIVKNLPQSKNVKLTSKGAVNL